MSEQKLKMPEGLSQLLIGRPSKVVPVATEPEEPIRQEIDKLISTPVQPNCGGCMQAMTKTEQGGWICNPCREKALVMMAGRTPDPVTAEPPTPVEVTKFADARRKVYAELLQVKESVDSLLKLTFGDDLMGKAVKARIDLAILEARIVNPELGEIDLAHLPDEYRLVGANRTARMGNEALTEYGEVSTKSTWSRR